MMASFNINLPLYYAFLTSSWIQVSKQCMYSNSCLLLPTSNIDYFLQNIEVSI